MSSPVGEMKALCWRFAQEEGAHYSEVSSLEEEEEGFVKMKFEKEGEKVLFLLGFDWSSESSELACEVMFAVVGQEMSWWGRWCTRRKRVQNWKRFCGFLEEFVARQPGVVSWVWG